MRVSPRNVKRFSNNEKIKKILEDHADIAEVTKNNTDEFRDLYRAIFFARTADILAPIIKETDTEVFIDTINAYVIGYLGINTIHHATLKYREERTIWNKIKDRMRIQRKR